MLTNDFILDCYYKIDRKSNKLDKECLDLLFKIKTKLGISMNTNFNIKEIHPANKLKKNRDIKDGSLDKVIGDIKINLNKLTDKNYEKIKEIIISIINNYDSSDFFKDVSFIIFNIITKNKLNSKPFSKLYKDLCDVNDIFLNLLHKNLNEYCDSFESIEYVSPNDNYSKFCEYIKQNENKVSLSSFFLECYKLDIIELNLLLKIINNCINLLKKNIIYESNNSICEEIIENIYVLLSGLELKNKSELKNIVYNLDKEYLKTTKSYNNKIRFKIMDIEDLIIK
tara:strand:+ start:2549 stop:3397 length:849 start_codon:yes stop_codon:yes gene_type:complete